MIFSNDSSLVYALTWSIVHSLWQGGLVYIALSAYFYLNPRQSAAGKFTASWVGLVSLFIMTLSTFIYLVKTSRNVAGDSANEWMVTFKSVMITSPGYSIDAFIHSNSHYIASLWFTGFALLGLRYIMGYTWLRYQVSKAEQLDLPFLNIKSMAASAGINRNVVVKRSMLAGGPFTMGVLQSVIFLPVAVLNRLSEDEIKAVIAHELAHIRRNDFMLNLLAAGIETILYYHPVVWWLQKKLALHREEACDDEVVALTGNAIAYARALMKIQEIEQTQKSPALVMAASGNNKNQLLNRIKRLFNMSHSPNQMREKLMVTMVLILLGMGLTEVYAYKKHDGRYSIVKAMQLKINHASADMERDTMPKQGKRKSVTIIKSDDENEILLKMENGDIKSLIINGQEVPPDEYEKHKQLLKEIEPDPKENKFSDEFSFHEFMDLFSDSDAQFKTFSFGFPGEMIMMKPDSLGKSFMIQADSFTILKDLFKLKRDSLRNFLFIKPDGDARSFHFSFPEKGLEPDGLNLFDGILPGIQGFDLQIEDEIGSGISLRPEQGHLYIKPNDGANLEQLIGSQLNRDGFLTAGKMNKIELSGKYLKINGEKQSVNTWNKYRQLFENETGMKLSKDTRLVFEIEGKTTERKLKSI